MRQTEARELESPSNERLRLQANTRTPGDFDSQSTPPAHYHIFSFQVKGQRLKVINADLYFCI